MLRAHRVEERRESRAAAAVGIVRRRTSRDFWQNGGLAGCGHAWRANPSTRVRRSRRARLLAPRLGSCLHDAPLSMLPIELDLELRSRLPARGKGNARSRRCSSCTAATATRWCWDAYFLPWFARARLCRVRVVAARTRRHRAATIRCSSSGSTTTSRTSSTSMGQLRRAAGADRPFDGRGGVRAAPRDAPAARSRAHRAGAAGGARQRSPRASPPNDPDYADADGCSSTRRGSRTHVLESLRPFYFSDDVDPAILRRSRAPLLASNRRAHCSICRCGCTGSCPSAATSPLSRAGRRGRPHLRTRRRARDRAPSRRRRRRSCRASRT